MYIYLEVDLLSYSRPPSVLVGFLDCSVVKNLPAMQEVQETWVWSLGQEDILKEEMVIYSSSLAWKIPWAKEPGGLQSIGL